MIMAILQYICICICISQMFLEKGSRILLTCKTWVQAELLYTDLKWTVASLCSSWSKTERKAIFHSLWFMYSRAGVSLSLLWLDAISFLDIKLYSKQKTRKIPKTKRGHFGGSVCPFKSVRRCFVWVERRVLPFSYSPSPHTLTPPLPSPTPSHPHSPHSPNPFSPSPPPLLTLTLPYPVPSLLTWGILRYFFLFCS
jgi:hypothetical protein